VVSYGPRILIYWLDSFSISNQ